MTLHLVDMPHGCRPIICKHVLKRKLKPDGTIDKYKARLVAKGFRQSVNTGLFDIFFLQTLELHPLGYLFQWIIFIT